ncbi:MAG: ABC transporter ATP-binding protein [Limnobacter sp.]|nr:ABC transporter ATP-binding protein [Limnobacter sp.]
MPILSVHGLEKAFGGLHAVDGVSFEVAEGELLGLIGPNGSGKTTVLNMLSGVLDPDGGEVRLDGQPVAGLSADRLARRGMLRMFQLTRVFDRMPAFDNLLTSGLALGMDEAAATTRASELAEELRLEHVMHLDARQLSGGQRKLLEFGACFMVRPRVALLDEPFAAVHPTMKEVMAQFIRRRHAEGQTFLLVSHDMPVIVELCPRAICMNAGKVLAEGPTAQVLGDRQVIEAYLGGGDEDDD